MKTLILSGKALKREGRWDIDYHLPAVGIGSFPKDSIKTIRDVADIVKLKRDPTKEPDSLFQYVDISSVDVSSGTVERPQELTGSEAPSRARKVVEAFDIIVSTCRPTRGAIAIIPDELHGQICSTGFSVLRAKPGVNPYFLHFCLRLPSTLEQFRKWSTGSSYPAILDDDVLKTRIPTMPVAEQDAIAEIMQNALRTRQEALLAANREWASAQTAVTESLSAGTALPTATTARLGVTVKEIAARLAALGPVRGTESEDDDDDPNLFGDDVDE